MQGLGELQLEFTPLEFETRFDSVVNSGVCD